MAQRTDTIVSGVSYAGGATSVVAGLTLTDVGIIIGIVTALATFAFNWFYQHKKHTLELERNRREQAEHEARMAQLRGEE